MSEPRCARGCRMVPVLDHLWLCDHAAAGTMTNLKGVIEDARLLLDRAGGYRALRERLDEAARRQKDAREERLAQGRERLRRTIVEHR